MALMTGRGFQEEGEAAGKWRRALLTSTQLSTYFVGYTEVADDRRGPPVRRDAAGLARRDARPRLPAPAPPAHPARRLTRPGPAQPRAATASISQREIEYAGGSSAGSPSTGNQRARTSSCPSTTGSASGSATVAVKPASSTPGPEIAQGWLPK